MKAKFLKIAGVKSEKEFYKKYPTEAAFFKAHPEAKKQIKKAQVGSFIGGEIDASPETLSYHDYEDLVSLRTQGKTLEKMKQEALEKAQLEAMKGSGAGSGAGGGSGMGDMVQQLLDGMGGGKKLTPVGLGTTGSSDPLGLKAGAMSGAPTMATQLSSLPGRGKEGKKVKKAQGGGSMFNSGAETRGNQTLQNIGASLPIVGGLFKAGAAIKDLKERRKKVEAAANVSDLALKASQTQPERKARRYVRPEDAVVSPNERFIPGGTGTEILAEYGASIGGNSTEIQNTYNPGDLYSNLGYEPLSDSDIIKQYRSGGLVPKAASGFGDFMTGGGGQAISGLVGSAFSGDDGGGAIGSEIGGSIGQGVGMLLGPVGSAIAGPAGQLLGGAIGAAVDGGKARKEKRQKQQIKRNTETMAMQDSVRGALGNYSAHVRNGGDIPYGENGWVSHDWQPQKITKFGEHDVEDLFRPDKTMDTLRTGGNIRQNYLSEVDRYSFGGNLKTHWGGKAEHLSHNPYLPGTGETVMFRGQSHDESDGKGRTGIGVSYGEPEHDSYTDYAEYGTEAATQKADVEVERNEPAAELPDGNGGLAMTVFGALPIPKWATKEIGDKDAQGKTFKKYIADVSKKEAKVNKEIEKANKGIEDLDVVTPFDRLAFNSYKASLYGGNQKQLKYANIKADAASVQNAINETAEEHGVDADALAKGKIKLSKEGKQMAKYGIEIAQGGIKKKAATTSGYEGTGRPTVGGQGDRKPVYTNTAKPKGRKKTNSKKTKDRPQLKMIGHDYEPKDWAKEELDKSIKAASERIKKSGETSSSKQLRAVREAFAKKEAEKEAQRQREKQERLDMAKTIIPQLTELLRRPYQEDLDPSQLIPEMLAKSQNQLEPVQAQTYQPLLDVPFDISLQDQLNENQASFNALQRQLGANPAALSALAAQKYQADSKVLGEQFRLNQGMRAGVFSKNRDALNESAIRNLGILDQQYVRQQEAISKTKAADLEIAKSITDKIAKNKLENRTFAAYSNLFPQYRFNSDMMATVQNPTFFQNGIVGQLAGNEMLTQLMQGKGKKKKKKEEEEETEESKFGKRLKKGLSNGSIVKSLKNI